MLCIRCHCSNADIEETLDEAICRKCRNRNGYPLISPWKGYKVSAEEQREIDRERDNHYTKVSKIKQYVKNGQTYNL